MPRLSALLVLALATTLAAPSGAADPIFPGNDRVELTLTETGTLTGSVAHDYSDSDWLRTYTYRVEFTRIGVYDLQRVDGIDAFAGTGELFREATGTLEITLDDQGVPNRLVCELEWSETTTGGAFLMVIEGTLIVSATGGRLDSDAWACDDSGVQGVVHGGAGDVPLGGYAVIAAEGLESGAFPAAAAVALGFAENEAEWEQEGEKSGYDSELVAAGYVEAEPKLGTQTVPYAREHHPDEDGLSTWSCPSAGVDDTPATSASCTIDGEVKLEIAAASGASRSPSGPSASSSPPSSSPSASPPSSSSPSAAQDGGADAPGAGIALTLAALVGLVALTRGRRQR